MDPVAGGPTAIATVQGDLGDLAFDGTNFYASVSGYGIVRIPAAGGTPAVLVKGEGAVAVDDECVYWTDSTAGIFSVAKTAQGPFNQ